MDEITNLIEELKNLGFNKEQVEELMKVAEQEIIDLVIDDFSLNAEPKVLDEYLEKFTNAKNSPSELTNLLNEIIAIQYGQENIQKRKEQLLKGYLRDIISTIKQTKELFEKYKQGDAEAVKFVEEAKKNPAIMEFVKELEENPQDKG